jgi:hypothetical protein
MAPQPPPVEKGNVVLAPVLGHEKSRRIPLDFVTSAVLENFSKNPDVIPPKAGISV